MTSVITRTTIDWPARSRTRRAILAAAAVVLAADRTATLAQVAEVDRSTLHRYFPDRDGTAETTLPYRRPGSP